MRLRSLIVLGAALGACAVYDPALLDRIARTDGSALDADHAEPLDVAFDQRALDVTMSDGDASALDTEITDALAPDVHGADSGCRCASGETCCEGACVSLASNPSHCGRCANVCPGTTCVAGGCSATCTAGFGDCDGTPATGCETNITTSVAHCGRCGNACSFANAAVSCVMGSCRMGRCNAGFADCDGNPANGCEVDTRVSVEHCGACGMRCVIPGMIAVCNAGRCEPRTCAAGRGECDSNPATVCETDLNTSLSHCGACGNACAVPNARNVCMGGVCGTAGCNAGFGNCDGTLANGCETDLNTSLDHCGACGARCARNNATTSCVSGVCSITACSAGFGNCDANPANGCETAVSSATNCGACGVVCSSGLCIMGVCDEARVVQLSAGAQHTCVRRNNGTLACWGNGADGQLGNGSTANRLVPTPVNTIADAIEISAGRAHTCARSASQVQCWGNAATHQLGSGSMMSSAVPVRAGSLGVTQSVSAGAGHSCVVNGSGSFHMMMCWGDNALGQVGNGTMTTPITTPTTTNPNFFDWLQVAAGSHHSCGRRQNNTVFCWGDNSAGQLGTGMPASSPGPVQATGILDAAEVATGSMHSCARHLDGRVSCWGDNSAGQLGTGDMLRRSSRVYVPGINDAIAIAAGAAHTCALRMTGAVLCWGRNTDGQLGDGTTANRVAPTSIASLASNVVEIAAGGDHTCARRADHRVLCWGRNNAGQLGDGTTVNRLVPSLVQSLY